MDIRFPNLQESLPRNLSRKAEINLTSFEDKDKMENIDTFRHRIHKIVRTYKKRNTINPKKFIQANTTPLKIAKQLAADQKTLSHFTPPVTFSDNSTKKSVTLIYSEHTDRLLYFLLTFSIALTVVCTIFAVILYVLRPHGGSTGDEDENYEVDDTNEYHQENFEAVKHFTPITITREISMHPIQYQVGLDSVERNEQSRSPEPDSNRGLDQFCMALKKHFLAFLVLVQQGRRNRAVADAAFVDEVIENFE